MFFVWIYYEQSVNISMKNGKKQYNQEII